MSTRTTVLLSLALVLLAVILSLSVYGGLPLQMASHWNLNDQVDGYLPRFWGAFLMPMLTLGLLGLLMLVPRIDPLKANIAAFRNAYNLFVLLTVVFLAYLHALIVAWNLGWNHFRLSAALLPAVGLLLICLGVLLRNVKRNYFIGIRTPWTLSSDSVWEQTHALGSKLFIGCGLLSLLGAFLGGATALVFMLIPLLGCTLFLVFYSYQLYRRESRI
ncbi:MAG TPA: SdpI family protein [Anaerolineales bacterium]|jgi:uncharacterized membrane protein